MEYVNNNFDDYFSKKGIRVRYNCLGFDKKTIRSYLKESYPIFLQSGQIQSNFIKSLVYEKYYPLTERPKATGFENLKKLEFQFRCKYRRNCDVVDLWDYPNETYDVYAPDNEKYIDNLKDALRTIEDPIVFFSGGMDSELLVNTFLDTKLPFKCVIFIYKDTHGNIINRHDIEYAVNHCQKNGIDPIIKDLCPETLWKNEFFIKIAKDLKLVSPQLATHAYMIYMINELYPDHTYCFAGEIRYNQNGIDPEKRTVIMQSAKVNPLTMNSFYQAGYGGGSGLVGPWQANGAAVQCKHYFNSIGQWSQSHTGANYFTYGGNTYINSSQEDSGTWTTTPGRNYQHAYLNISNYNPDSGVGLVSLTGSGGANPWNWTIANSLNEGVKGYVQVSRVSSGAWRGRNLRWQISSVPAPGTVFVNTTWVAEWTV